MRTVICQDLQKNTYDVPVGELRWRPSAYAVVMHEGRVLLVGDENGYHVPGGGVELGETPEEAVVREIKEETGLVASNPRLTDSHTSFFTFMDSGGAPVHNQALLMYYICDVSGGELSTEWLEDEERAVGHAPEWVAIDRLNEIKVGSTVDWRPLVRRAVG